MRRIFYKVIIFVFSLLIVVVVAVYDRNSVLRGATVDNIQHEKDTVQELPTTSISPDIAICNKDEYPQDCDDIADPALHWSENDNPMAIQNMVDNSSGGQTVLIKRGNYTPTTKQDWVAFIEDKDFVFYGEGTDKTILGANFYNGFLIDGTSNVELYDLTLDEMLYEGIVTIGDGNIIIKDCIISGSGSEEIPSGPGTYGAGWNMRIHGIPNLRVENTIIEGSWFEGAWVETGEGAEIEFINNLFINNEGNGRPGGISIFQGPNVKLINNIIVNNGDKGIFLADSGEAKHTGTLENSYNNVWNNKIGNWVGLAKGEGSISEDPKFSDDIYHLNQDSPSKDTGHPDICDDDFSRSDMGVYGGGSQCGVFEEIDIQVGIDLDRKENDTNEHVRVKLKQGPEEINAYVKTNSEGKSELFTVNLKYLGDYDVYIKPEQYISKRETIKIGTDLNSIIFNHPFRVGDISHSSYDFINALDFSLFIKYLREQNMLKGDVNLDGAVNAVDYSIILKTYREDRQGYLVLDPEK